MLFLNPNKRKKLTIFGSRRIVRTAQISINEDIMAGRQKVITFLNDKLKVYSKTTNNQWYVGIASDPDDRLFEDHNVSKTKDHWAYIPADSEIIARSVEKHFLDAGCDGGPGGGGPGSRYVYVYFKSSRTHP